VCAMASSPGGTATALNLRLAALMTAASQRFDELPASGKARLGHTDAKVGIRILEIGQGFWSRAASVVDYSNEHP
jgi:hypothetical protein